MDYNEFIDIMNKFKKDTNSFTKLSSSKREEFMNMYEKLSNATLEINEVVEKYDTSEKGLQEVQRLCEKYDVDMEDILEFLEEAFLNVEKTKGFN